MKPEDSHKSAMSAKSIESPTTKKEIFLPKYLKRIASVLGVLLLIFIGVYIYQFWGNSLGQPEQFGQLGDYIGGLLNPILGFFTIFLLVWSINKQLDELDLTRKELEFTRVELAKSAEAMDSAQTAHNKSYELQLNEVKRIQIQQALNEQYHEFESNWNQPFLKVKPNVAPLSLEDVFDLRVHQANHNVLSLKKTVESRMNGEYKNEVATIRFKELKATVRRICQFTEAIYNYIESPPIASALHTKAANLNEKLFDIKVISDNEYNINKSMIRLPDELNDLL